MTPELQAKVQLWRARAAAGTLSTEDQKEAIRELRAGRIAASKAGEAKKRTTARAVVKSGDDMLSELEDL